MHAADLFNPNNESGPTFSFEFFPPKTEAGSEKLFEHVRALEKLRPTYVSVTYGAGGTTAHLTEGLVRRISSETSINVMPHLTCIGHTEEEIADLLGTYADIGIDNILCLGGDPPRDQPDYDRTKDRFRYAADLVEFTASFDCKRPDGRGFGIAVAGFPEGHPSTPNRLIEMDYLKHKVDAGAHVIVTQLFFDNRDLYDFRERCELAGITIPIVAGIMPITSYKSLSRMAELAAGSRYPAPLLRSIERVHTSYADMDAPEAKEAIRRVGVHWATEQCRDLLDNQIAGIHFYTLNHSTATEEIYKTLGVTDSAALAQSGKTVQLR